MVIGGFMNNVSYTTQRHFLVGALFVLCSCGKLPGFVVQAKTDSFKQDTIANDKIDILFVVDNSGSMSNEQNNLGNSFESFISNFTQRNLDFHIGVISTDHITTTGWWTCTGAYANLNNCAYPNIQNAGPGSLLSKTGNDRYLTKNSSNLIDQFAQNVALGIRGGGNEAGVLAAIKFFNLGLSGPGGWNSGFLRDEALLTIIFVSDEDETKAVGTSNIGQYIRRFETEKNARLETLYSTLSSLKPGKPELLSAHAVIAPSSSECPTVGGDSGNPSIPGIGLVYKEAAARISGPNSFSNICTDFSPAISQLGEDLVKLLTKFKLVQVPTGQIEIRVDGVLIPRDATNGWEYLAETNEVEFRGSGIPSANAQISVSYVPGAPLR
jgi:hypothetical protein